MFMTLLGVIGGSGVYEIPGLAITETVKLTTPYGDPSDAYRLGTCAGTDVAFLPRHGSQHRISPHKINYRANMWGFRELGINKILSVSASGAITLSMEPGSIILPDQIIDMTSGRHSTFYENDVVIHVDFTDPFCPVLREHLIAAAETAQIRLVRKGTYLCVNGPRLETAAEIRAFSVMGADIVGMTGMPEAILARELEICFAGLSVITNYAAGIAEKKLSTTQVVEQMKVATETIASLLTGFFRRDVSASACACSQALKHAAM